MNQCKFKAACKTLVSLNVTKILVNLNNFLKVNEKECEPEKEKTKNL